ncbi:hypothetical protein ACC685_33425 [Rhizobium ruizarguesonis]
MNSATIQTQINELESDIKCALVEAAEMADPEFSFEAAMALAEETLIDARYCVAWGFKGWNTFEQGAKDWFSLTAEQVENRVIWQTPRSQDADAQTSAERKARSAELLKSPVALAALIELHGLRIALGIAQSIEEIKAA